MRGVYDKRFLRPSKQGLRARLNEGLLSIDVLGCAGGWGAAKPQAVYLLREFFGWVRFGVDWGGIWCGFICGWGCLVVLFYC